MRLLENKIAIITGAGRGIGKATAHQYSQEGATVIIAEFDEQSGQETANSIGGHFFKTDISSQKSVTSLFKYVKTKFNRLNILVNNAGVIRDRSFMKMTQEEWDTVININLTGMFIVTKAVFPLMKEAGYGRIISASSINAFQGAFGQANYSATKAGINGFTRALCKEGGKYGITVNAVAPGFIKSLMSDSMPEEIIKAGIAQIPVGRIGTPEDMGYTYLFLASKEAGFISGITLHANGGAMPM